MSSSADTFPQNPTVEAVAGWLYSRAVVVAEGHNPPWPHVQSHETRDRYLDEAQRFLIGARALMKRAVRLAYGTSTRLGRIPENIARQVLNPVQDVRRSKKQR